MAGQIAGISPLMTSFCFSFRYLSTASIKYKGPPPRQPTLAVQEDVFVQEERQGMASNKYFQNNVTDTLINIEV